jgi:hypothetical protein
MPEPRVDCPECALDVPESRLALHRYRAHQIDRRQGQQTTRASDTPSAKRKPAQSKGDDKDGDNEKQPAEKTSRWAEVRKSW